MSLQCHVDFGFNPVTTMWNIHFLPVVVSEAAAVIQLVEVSNQVAQTVRDIVVGRLLGNLF